MDTMERDVIDVRADGSARRRREYSDAFKRRVVALAREPGISVSEVARRYGLNTNLVFSWKRDPQYSGKPEFPKVDTPRLLAVSVCSDAGDAKQERSAKQVDTSEPCIEVEIGSARVRLHGGVDMQTVAGVLRLLERGR
jgi:transposase